MSEAHALDWPEQLDRDIAEDIARHATDAKRKWACKAIGHATARLYYAGEVQGHRAACDQADDAFDALLVAGDLAPEPHRTALWRLALRLNETPADGIGHPSDDVLEAVSAEAQRILAALGGPAR